MIYVIPIVILTGLFTQFYKIAHRRNCDLAAVNFGSFLASFCAVIVYLTCAGGFHAEAQPIGLGAVAGALVCGAIALFFLATRDGKLSVCWTIIGLSSAIPVIVCFIVWRESEPITLKKVAGLFLAAAAIILLGLDKSKEAKT